MSNAPLRSPDQIVAGAPSGIQRTAPQSAQAERPNPFALYYSPDQIVDEQGNMRSGLSPYAPFRGESAYAKVMGFTPPLPPQYFWPEEGGVGSGSGGGSGQPFVYNQAPPAPPSLERLQPQSFNMQDPYPAPQRGPEPAPFQTQGAPPEPYRRDNAKYRKLLGY